MESTTNIFEKALRKNLRFSTTKGSLTTEDLWDLKLETLDTLAKGLKKTVDESGETSYIKKTSSTNETAKLAFEIVLYIIEVKMKEAEVATQAAEKRAKKAKLLELIDSKENEALGNKTIEELKADLASM